MSEMDRNNGGFAPFQSELEGGQEPLGQVDYSLETLLKKVKEHSPLSDTVSYTHLQILKKSLYFYVKMPKEIHCKSVKYTV